MLKLKEMFTKEKIFTKRNIIIAIVTLLTIALAVTGFCIWKGNSGKKGFNSRPDFEAINKTHSTALAAPKDGSTPFNYDPNKNAYYAFGVMNETDSFVGRGEGVTATKVGFANVNQYIKSHRVVNEGEVYKESVSFSKFKGVGVRTFVKGDNYVIHKAAKVSSVNNVTWKDEASKVTQEAFLQAYGVVPNSITAYILTDETILSAEYLGEDNGIYSYKYKLEPSKSTVKIALEMRSMAGVKSLPLFTDVNLIIRMDKNWRVTETVTDCTYDVDMLGGVTCTEKLTEVFTDYEKEVEIPDLEFYHSYLDAEITEPTEKEETALDYLMGGFGDYITGGKPLKVRLLAEGNESLPLSLAGNAEIKIDMEDLSATSARVDVDNLSYGDIALSDLFIGYGKERVYLALDDFKAYGSIDEMGAVIGRLLPIFGVEGDLGSSFASMDLNGILENATLTKDGENATVSMPIDLGGMHIDAQLKFKQTDTKITFVEGNVSVAGVAVTLAIDDSISVAEIGQDYHNIAPLFDLIDEDGRINLEVVLGEINALVNFDVKSLSADIGLGDLTARYAQENLYLNYNGLKAKLALADINPMFAKLKPIIENFVDLSALETLGGTVDVLGIVGQAVNELHIEEKDNVLTISTSIEGVAAAINLAVTEEGYTIKSVDVTVKETTVSLAPTDKTFAAITEEEQANYKSIATLLDIIDENGSVRLDVNVGEINALVDFNLYTLVADVNLDDLVAKYADETLYLNYKGLKAKLAIADVEPTFAKLKPIISNFADLSALETLGEGMDVTSLLGTALNELTITEAEDVVTISTTVEGVSVALNLAIVNEGYTIQSIELNVKDTAITVAPTTETVTAIPEEEQANYKSIATLLDIIDENGSVRLDVNVGEINALVDFNLHTLVADVNLDDLIAKYADETLYLNYKGLKAKLAIADVEPTFAKLKPIISNFADLSALETLGEGMDVASLLGTALNELTITEGEDVVTISTTVEGVSVALNLAIVNDGYTIQSIELNVKDTAITVAPTTETVTAIPEEEQANYKSIATLLDIIDENGSVRLDVNVGEINALVDFNLHTLVADVNLDDLVAKYADETLYLNYKGLKAKLAIADVEPTFAKLKPIISNFADLSALETLGEGMDVASLLGTALNELTITEGEDVVTISTTVEGVSVALNLAIVNDGYTIQSIELNVKDMAITVAPTDKAVTAILESEQVTYKDITGLLDIIDDENNVSLVLDLGGVEMPVTLNLITFELYAYVEGAEIYADFQTGDIYARYPGVKAMLNFNDVEEIIAKLQPLLDKFLGEGTIPEIDMDNMTDVSVDELLSSIIVSETEGMTSVGIDFKGIGITLNLNTAGEKLALENVIVLVEGMEISAVQAESALSLDFDLSETYIDLKALVDDYAETLTDVLFADSLYVTAGGSLVSGNSAYTIKDVAISIDGINTAPRADARLTLEISETKADGTVSVSTHELRLVYLDPTLVAEGASNVYFTYDNKVDAAVFEGTFTTTKAGETWNTIKEIYSNIPEIQDLLKPIIIPNEEGYPTLPEASIDFTNMINLIDYADGVISADLNGQVFMKSLPASMFAQLTNKNGTLGLDIPSLTMDGLAASLNLAISVPAEGTFTDETFAYSVSNASDFSSINTLLQTLSNTATCESFHLTGTVNMEVIGIDINDKIKLDAKLDIVDGKVYAAVTLKREHVIIAWDDYDGQVTLYYDPVEEMIYIEDVSRTRSGFIIYNYTTTYTYSKYTVDEFMADPLTPIMNMLHFSDTIENAILNAEDKTSDVPPTIENTFLKYSYNGTDTFHIDLDLEPLLVDVQDVAVDIKHDANMYASGLYAKVGLVSVINLTLDAKIETPYNTYQGVPEAIAEQKASGNYA